MAKRTESLGEPLISGANLSAISIAILMISVTWSVTQLS